MGYMVQTQYCAGKHDTKRSLNCMIFVKKNVRKVEKQKRKKNLKY